MMCRPSRASGLTLVELLVVIVIIAVLFATILPVLRSVQTAGRRAACVSNLRQIGMGIGAYAGDNDGLIPYGPKAPPFTNMGDFYPSTGAPTSLISLQGGAPVGLGLLLDKYLSKTPRVLFCPGADQAVDAVSELAKVGKKQAQSSYYYRHGGNISMFDPFGKAPDPKNIRLGYLGDNRKGKPVRALVMDTVFLCPEDLAPYEVTPKTNHLGFSVNVLYSDGHVTSQANRNKEFTIDLNSASALASAFDRILKAFEYADELP